jgi:hypothetical protein
MVCPCLLLPVKCFTCVLMVPRGLFGVVWVASRAFGRLAIDSQHGTDVEGSSHPCTKGLSLQVSSFFVFALISTHFLIIHCIYCKYVFVLQYSYVSPLQGKHHMTRVQNMHLFLGSLAWLQPMTCHYIQSAQWD